MPQPAQIPILPAARSGQDALGGPSLFTFATSNAWVRVESSGRGTLAAGSHLIDFSLPLQTPESERIDNLFWAELATNLLIAYVVSDGESDAGQVTLLDARTGSVQWTAGGLGFNIGEGLVAGGSAFLSSTGCVAKLNLSTGQYAWKHDDLYPRDPAFNHFERPRLNHGFVCFPSSKLLGHPHSPVVCVNDATGALEVSGELNR